MTEPLPQNPIARRGISHILLGTDASDESMAADEWARDIALAVGARVTVVCAFDSPRAFRKRGSIYLEQARDELQAQATRGRRARSWRTS